MNEDYLWDRSGPPDPEIEALERTLAPLRYKQPAKVVAMPKHAPVRNWLAVAAAALLAMVAVWQVNTPVPPPTGWSIAGVEGTARVGRDQAGVSMPLRAGQLVRTGSDSNLRLEAEDFGQIDLGSHSELRAESKGRLQFNRGSMRAFIWARPGQFVVDTPSARATDLGCIYNIQVDPSGDGLLEVIFGWVAFQHAGHESFIPAGAACVTRKRRGPGIPYYQDAPQALRTALTGFEKGEQGWLNAILESARPHDGLTLWHLLARVPARDRGAVFDRFAQLVPLPTEVSREGALRLDAKTMDLCWNALNLKNTEWWRGWERKWGG
jgi:FecR protein